MCTYTIMLSHRRVTCQTCPWSRRLSTDQIRRSHRPGVESGSLASALTRVRPDLVCFATLSGPFALRHATHLPCFAAASFAAFFAATLAIRTFSALMRSLKRLPLFRPSRTKPTMPRMLFLAPAMNDLPHERGTGEECGPRLGCK